MTDKITGLAQKLYTEDGHTGNIYKKAPVNLLRSYEARAQEISEEAEAIVDLIVYTANHERVKKELEPNIMSPMDITHWMVRRVLPARQIVIEAAKNEQAVSRANKK